MDRHHGVALILLALAASASEPAVATAQEPVFAQSVELTRLRGTVTVTVPGGEPTVLRASRIVPVGTELDVRTGTAAVVGARGPGRTLATADVRGGRVRVTQPSASRKITRLELIDTQCDPMAAIVHEHTTKTTVPSGKKRLKSKKSAVDPAVFEVVGRSESASNKGDATWETEDFCETTSVTPRDGKVTAVPRDFTTREKELTPGHSWILKCSDRGRPPVTGHFCAALLGEEYKNGVVRFAAGLFVETPEDRYELCVTPPGGERVCRTWAFSAPDHTGSRDGLVACDATRRGKWTVSWRIRGVPVADLPPYVAPHASATRQPCHGTFGSAYPPGQARAPLRTDSHTVNRYPLLTPGWLNSLSLFVDPANRPGLATIEGVVYADVNGAPGSLLGVTKKVVVKSTNDPDYRDLFFRTPLPLAAGNYWFGVLTAGEELLVAGRFDTGGELAWAPRAIAGVPNDPFGRFTRESKRMSFQMDYSVDPP